MNGAKDRANQKLSRAAREVPSGDTIRATFDEAVLAASAKLARRNRKVYEKPAK
jgi:hypothetical protein